MPDFGSIFKYIDDIYTTTAKRPNKILMNENWLDEQIKKDVFLKDNPPSKNLMRFTGIPVEIDNSIETFDFVYAD